MGVTLKDWYDKDQVYDHDTFFVRDENGEIVQFSKGTGSSADVRYVTFMSYDGLTEYGKKAVAVGDDCADPIARGIFDTPTRESDVQYNYTHNGWATMANGEADVNALKTVTEDKTVYATYTSALRYYNARFYDGDTLVATVATAYGTKAVAPAIDAKDGYKFEGWNPSDMTVYGDTDFTAIWVELTGYYHITTISEFPDTYIQDMAITNDGSHIAVGMSGTDCALHVYDLSGDTPTLIENTETTIPSAQRVDYNYDETALYRSHNKSASSKYTNYYGKHDITNGTYGACSILGYGSSGYLHVNKIRCSPIDNTYSHGYSGSSQKIYINNQSFTIGVYVNGMEYSQDGEYVAVAANDSGDVQGFVNIYHADGSSLYKTITVNGSALVATFNRDSSLIAIAFDEAPYFALYSVETGEQVYSFGEQFTTKGYCFFVNGTNELVLASGTTVKVFECSASEPMEIEDVPAYQGGTVSAIRSNRSGTRIGIMSTEVNGIEIWGRV